MTWGKMDDKFHRNRKVRELRRMKGGREALGDWAFWWSWCLDDPELTGIVPAFELDAADLRSAKLLVLVGLWEEVEGGYRFHDFHEYNPTRQQRESKKAADRDRIATKREASRTDVARDTSATDERLATESPPARVPNPSHPNPASSSEGVDAPERLEHSEPVTPEKHVSWGYVLDAFKRYMVEKGGSLPLSLASSDRTKRLAQVVVQWAYEHGKDDPRGMVRASAYAFATKLAESGGTLNGKPVKDSFALWTSNPGSWLEDAA